MNIKKKLLSVILILIAVVLTGCDEISFDVEGQNYSITTGPTPENNFKPIASYDPEYKKILILGSDIPVLSTMEKMIYLEIENVDPENRTGVYGPEDCSLGVQYNSEVGTLEGDITVTLEKVEEPGGYIQGSFSGVLDNGDEITNGWFSVTNMVEGNDNTVSEFRAEIVKNKK